MEFKKDLTDAQDQELQRRKADLPEHLKKLERISKNCQEIMMFPSKSEDVIFGMKDVEERYENLLSIRDLYVMQLKDMISERELEKHDLFNEAHLNIKLSKFSGYGSQTDVYTFQCDFEKLYLRTTPKRVLSDLLKNNFLGDSALLLVKNEDDINEIWKRLKIAYGDPKTMLARKLADISKFDILSKIKDPEKVIAGLSKITNTMKDLMKISKKHDIERKLYNGEGLVKIFKLLGDGRITRWLSITCDQDLQDEKLWMKLIAFLEKDIKVQQQMLLIQGNVNDTKDKQAKDRHPKENTTRYRNNYHFTNNDRTEHDNNNVCYICGDSNHVATSGPGGSKVIQYFSCKQFVDMTPAERFFCLKEKGYCFQCLLPGADMSKGKHREGKCQRDFTCHHLIHEKYPSKKHVLVCHDHKDTVDNKELLQHYRERCILKNKTLPTFSREIKLSFHTTDAYKATRSNIQSNKEISTFEDRAIYQLQTIKIGIQNYTIFYDSGCADFISRHEAVQKLGSNAVQEYNGPIILGGVGDVQTQSLHGIYTVNIPLFNGKSASLSGVCLDKITTTFPTYPLQGKVETDIHHAFKESGGDIRTLPKLQKSIGGDIDFMIGIKYLRYHPEMIFQLPSGLTIYRSMFQNADGGRGVIGGPHKVFTFIEQHFNIESTNNLTFFTDQYKLYRMGYQVNPDVSMLGFKGFQHNSDVIEINHNELDPVAEVYISKVCGSFDQAEEAGSVINYRCINCRSCKNCKNHTQIEAVSIKEEVEQDIINKSVKVDISNRLTVASLPFIHDPLFKLAPNKNKAMKTFNQQLKKLDKNPKDKDDVIKSEQKLQQLGHVDYVKNLSVEMQHQLLNNPIQNFIPWRAVWKDNSLSTPCRIVFDASQVTDTGFSLNDMLAKGRNNMNKLQEILIRWSIHPVAFHTDVTKMYNTVKLEDKNWCFQRYIWQENLDSKKIPEEKVIKTLIYGVKSSGNQAERGLRETARLSKEEYPEVNEIVRRDVYVDDCLSGERSEDLAMLRSDQLEIVLNRGGFALKGISFSGKDPPECLSDDGVSINVAGLKWYTKEDVLALDISELNFAKKCRGRKPVNSSLSIIPSKLTRRHCVSKVAEIFDLTGKITPITAGMKLDLHDLVQRKLDWDDVIPDNLRPLWESHFETMKEIKTLRYKRAIVPADAIDLNVTTIDAGDASQSIVCVSIYARFRRKNGQYSCQQVLSRSRLVPDGMSLPRAELYAALLNTYTGEIVKRSFYQWHQGSTKLTDSQIVLHWISNDEKPLKQWVRNRVIEIQRFTSPNQWYYVQSKNMVADIGTRKGTTLEEVNQSSVWINGFSWMQNDISEFPIKSVQEINLNNEDMQAMKKELPYSKFESDVHIAKTTIKNNFPDEVSRRYEVSNYIIDPNRHRFKFIIRVTAIVLKFVKILFERIRNPESDKHQKIQEHLKIEDFKVYLSEEEIKEAKSYFFKKCTLELKNFNKASKYENITAEKNGILMYTGRILPTNEVTIVGNFTSAMKDLSSTSFCVPVIDKHSPVAFSIVNEVHWHNTVAKHAGVETVLRYVLKTAFIIEGRSLVKMIKKSCERCRYLAKRTIDVAMSPVSQYNLTIAPAFYVTQVDLAGPFKAYSPHQKRTTIKIWLVIFCCTTTSATSIKVMDDYSSTAFIQAFIRFSCCYGYPKVLLPDEGSQLVKGCESMKLNFQNIKFRLHHDVSVEFEVCPVGGHNMHGKVERKIREIKISIEKNMVNERLSIIQWETLSAEIANTINDLPLALGNISSEFDTMDLLTPNRLLLGRNNNRSPIGTLNVTSDAHRIFKENGKIFNSWFENWLLSHVPKLMLQPKWFKTDSDLKKGDIVVFLKQDSQLSSTYQYGMVNSVEFGKDGLIRKAHIKYRNNNENVNRETYRSVRQLVMIHHIDEINIFKELGDAACAADIRMRMEMSK